jgi:hypothetical protein
VERTPKENCDVLLSGAMVGTSGSDVFKNPSFVSREQVFELVGSGTLER